MTNKIARILIKEIDKFVAEGKSNEEKGKRAIAAIMGSIAAIGAHIKLDKPSIEDTLREVSKLASYIFMESDIKPKDVIDMINRITDKDREIV